MAGEEISDRRYELNEDQQIALGKAVSGLVQGDLLRGCDLSCSHTVLSNPDYGDGRYIYLFAFYSERCKEDMLSGSITQAVAANGAGVIDSLKREFPELRRVEFEGRDGNVLVVICTLDEVVDSLEMEEGDVVENLARLKVGELEERSQHIQQALRKKGQQIVDGFGVDNVVCESVTLDGRQHKFVVNCGGVHPTGYERAEQLRAVIAKRGYDERGFSNLGGNIKVTFYVDAEVLDGPKVAGIVGEVAEEVTAATE